MSLLSLEPFAAFRIPTAKSVVAAQMAADDFGGSVTGIPPS
jgi:hypothetical protein